MSYVDEGPRSSEAIVCVHGNPTWSFLFRRLVSAVSPGHRIIALDHVGMGLSEKPQDYDYRLATRIRDLGNLIESLKLTKVHLVMHDWGGAIGSGWAVQNPERVGRIVYLNTSAFASSRIPTRIALCRSRFPGTLLVRGLNGFAWPATWMSMKRTRLTKEQAAAYLFPYGNWADRVAVDAFVKDIPMGPEHPTWQTLQNVEGGLHKLAEKEILLAWGGGDFCFDKSFFEGFKARFPQAGTLWHEGAGHYVLEDAQPLITNQIQEFLLG